MEKLFVKQQEVENDMDKLKFVFLIFLTLSWQNIFPDMAEKKTDACLEMGDFLITYNPEWAVKQLKTCAETSQKYALLVNAYSQLGDYESQKLIWRKYYELTKGTGSLNAWMSIFSACGKKASKTSNWQICAVVYYRDIVSQWSDNPYVYYFLALFTLKDPAMFDRKDSSGNLLIEYNSLFKQNETICSLAEKSLEKAFSYDKAKILEVPESFTKQCGKWKSPKKE